jgi:hypothetical protein
MAVLDRPEVTGRQGAVCGQWPEALPRYSLASPDPRRDPRGQRSNRRAGRAARAGPVREWAGCRCAVIKRFSRREVPVQEQTLEVQDE